MSCKNFLFRHAPPILQRVSRDLYFAIKLLPGHVYDYCRFLAYSGLNKSRGKQAERAARITLHYHQVEKGLSLADPRPGFGMTVIPGLLDDVDVYLTLYGAVAPATMALASVLAYIDHHRCIANPIERVEARTWEILSRHGISPDLARTWHGGMARVSRADLAAARCGDFRSFFESRYSVRQFAGGCIPETDIRTAVDLARKTPSVCNRQSWRVHAYSDRTEMTRLLDIQNGGRSFAEQASAILLITCELRSFLGVGERYQAWIDGGMFAMSLCLAFHDLGYGSCCLNWSKEPADDKKMRRASGIPNSEQIILCLAVGTLPEAFKVARSHRLPVDHILVVHGAPGGDCQGAPA